MRSWRTLAKSQAGLSLVEATVILIVLSIMTSVLAVSMQDYFDDARYFKAKEDCEAIGVSIHRMLRDTGEPFLLRNPEEPLATRFAEANRVDLAVSQGEIPGNAAGTGGIAAVNVEQATAWNDAIAEDWVSLLDYHLIWNEVPAGGGVGYAQPLNSIPHFGNGGGWRGAYLSPFIGPDPWNNRYMVNSVFLGTATDSADPASPFSGQFGDGWDYDTICISAGANNNIETNFYNLLDGDPGNELGGTGSDGYGSNDDVVYVLSGFTT